LHPLGAMKRSTLEEMSQLILRSSEVPYRFNSPVLQTKAARA
jgi:hypothetical protein